MANEVWVVVFFSFSLKEENNQKVGKMESREHICTQGNQTASHQNVTEGNPAKQVQPYLSLCFTPFLNILSLLWKKVDEARICKVKIMLWQQTETESENLESAGMKNTAKDGHLKWVPGSSRSPWQQPSTQYACPIVASCTLKLQIAPNRGMHTEMHEHDHWILSAH